MLNRRSVLTAAAALAASAALAAPAPAPDDLSLGNPKAKIEIIEYASLSCPHCAHFNEAVFPALKTKYIDTGKVRYTLKEMLTEPANVAAAGFLLARCAGPDKYFTVVDQVFRSQPRWTQGNVKPILAEIGAANGVDAAHFDACLQNQAAVDAVVGRAKRAADQDGVNSTPTLFINGKKIEAVPLTAEELDATIAAATKAPSANKGGR
ncbi:DsbA family protein [Phenylobacterium sp.]|uniref:DsbA family protein n=1 Tax=Phenylobacterium sp. TaxID=1871053 RepID=UPI00121823A1|nr:DsbA family protein [Phenylobacterium sp.]THD68504.1 MAG: DsbA family protein [Phenylobacterium sp.]